jgi:hypothetical protein
VPQALAVGKVRRRLDPLPGALDRRLEPAVVVRLEQIVHGLKLERRHGVSVERGGEDHGGPMPHPPGDLEAAETGHRQAQQRDVGAQLLDQAKSRVTVTGLAYDVQVGERLRELPELLP